MSKIQFTSDLHMHSIYSNDGHDTPDAMFRRGLELGLEAMAITEHAEWHNGENGFPRIEPYFDAMLSCRKKYASEGLQVYTGIELGNPHLYARQFDSLLGDYPFDIIIGSVHWLYDVNIHDTVVFKGRDLNMVYADYFDEIRRLVTEYPIDILAHFDRILWRATLVGLPFDPYPIEDTIRNAFQAVMKSDVALELNTRHLAMSPTWREHLMTMLGWYKEEGGRGVVVNSDAHRTGHIALNFDIADQLLSQAGMGALTPEVLGELTLLIAS
ncbi:MAG TPA: histidinol-phosphatase HisJ family protein [Anaerolineales bacterium]|nr:histidinol-phosphatase HisJ family protein [Anaerolineales bacterium]